MFQIGAINPNVGNDRRNQLLQQLMQQFMQQQGAGMPGQPAPPTNLFQRQRRTPVFGTAERAGSLRPGGGRSQVTGGNMIPTDVAARLGPGGIFRAAANVMSPSSGAPVPGLGRPGALPAMTGSPIPTGQGAPTPPGATPGGSNKIVPGVSPVTLPAPTASQQSPIDAQKALMAQYASAQTLQAQGNQAGAAAMLPSGANPTGGNPAGIGAVPMTTPSGMIPLGNGVFFNPTTGAMFGGTVGTFGRIGV